MSNDSYYHEKDYKAALNKALYRRVKATFGHVRLANKQESQQRSITTDLASGRRVAKITHPGEYYRVCCPFCPDTRFKLYINHRYGTEDEFGRQQLQLAYCFRAGCPLEKGDSATYQKLSEMLLGRTLIKLSKANISEGVKVDVDAIRANWPGKVVRIDRLGFDHPAVKYLIERKFDPARIGKFWNVHYCYESDKRMCKDRLIIPIYHNKKMVGWQARAAFECDWKKSRFPKYYTAPGTPRRSILYNLGNAKNYKSIVVAEGVTDVWRIGPQAVCTLGATMTAAQTDLIRNSFADHSGVLLFDPDVQDRIADKVKPIVSALNNDLKSGFCWVNLPEGRDPGSTPRREIWNYIQTEAKNQGVDITTERR